MKPINFKTEFIALASAAVLSAALLIVCAANQYDGAALFALTFLLIFVNDSRRMYRKWKDSRAKY